MTIKTGTALEVSYDDFKAAISSFRSKIVTYIALLQTEDSPSYRILDIYKKMDATRTIISTLIGLTGITDYVKTVEGDQNYNIVTEGNALILAIEDCIDWVDANFPTYTGYLLELQISDGSMVYRILTIAAAADFVTEMQEVVALIDA